MLSYIGKICPYCKDEFKENDEVISCSACEMPHHKECWTQNQGCTTFGCTGTIAEANDILVEKCGEIYEDGKGINSAIGNMNYKDQQQYDNITNNLNSSRNIDEEIYTFIGKNQEYFLPKFEELNNRKSKMSWNWASAFFGAYWYAYRKMYITQILYYIAFFLYSMLLNIIMLMLLPAGFNRDKDPLVYSSFELFIFVVPFLLSGFFANYIYKCHIEKHIKKADYIDVSERENYLMNKGGTSGLALMIFLIVNAFIKIMFRG